MAKNGEMKLAHWLAALLVIVVAGFSIYGFWSFKTLGNLKVNGPVYQHIVQGQNLIADILPPPEYIIEPYLVSLQAARAAPAERGALIARFKSLKRDYDTRHEYWAKENLEDALRDQMAAADKPAQEFFQVAMDQFIPALEKGDDAAISAALGLMKQHYEVHRAAIDQLVKLATKRDDTAESEAKAEIASSTRILLIILTCVTGLVALFLLKGGRNLMRKLGGEPSYAVGIAEKIAAGDLAVQIDSRPDDHSSLMFSMKTMRDSLARIVSEVRAGTDTIATASDQIAAGNLDLSSRTEEQVSSLTETASSMEELTSTAKQNGDNARQANQLAVSASEIAVKGGEVVAQVVGKMGAINESARKIADIIGVIDGIAFQTNILALNAAVEAARAGEQGRGFAVVASEVRSLAQRSAAAAKEIKELIGDSVEKVDAGSRLVEQAGATMEEIIASVKRVTDIIGEITLASTEQESGIRQINQAIAEMDSVTQQNAALVEQASAAAESLRNQASSLTQAVGEFKLDGMHGTASAMRQVRQSKPKLEPELKSAKLAATQAEPAKIAVDHGTQSMKSMRLPKIEHVSADANEHWEEF